MMRLLLAMCAGSIFGLGLMLSGMTDTSKVQGWLDVFGIWDPTLAFVLVGAILPMLITWRVVEKREKSLLGFDIPTPHDPTLDRKLVVGSALFGVGWAIVGYCPGPAMASLSYGGTGGLLFMASMIAGMIAYRKFGGEASQ